MKISKNELKTEFAGNRKLLEKAKKEVVKLLKSGEKDKKLHSSHLQKACSIVIKQKELIEKQKEIERELLLMGEIETDASADKDLLERVKDGDCAAIAGAVLDGVDIGKKDKDMWNALHIAALNGHEAIAEFLLKMGADVGSKTNVGQTPLHIAVSHNQTEAAKVFFKHGANPFIRDKEGRYPQELATSKEMRDLLEDFEQQFIKKTIAKPGDFLDHCPSILLCAVSKKYHSVLPLLLELHKSGTDVGFKNKDEKGNTVLHLAVMNDDHKSLDLLLSCEPYPFKKNNAQKYPVELAKSRKIKEKIETYEQKYIGIMTGNPDLISQMGSDLLLYCAEKGYAKAVQELIPYIRNGVLNINGGNADKNTPLHLAVKHGREDVAALLLKSGAELLVFNKNQLMPADYIGENKKLLRIFNNFDRIWVSRILHAAARESG